MTAAIDERDRRHLHPVDGGAGDTVGVEDGWPALVKPGLYRVAFLRCKRNDAWRNRKWRIDWRIVEEGEAFGVELPMFCTRVASADRLHPSRKIVHLFAVATDRRPPKNLWQYNPRQFLEGCTFTAKVTTTTRDGAHGVERPEALHTSVVATLERRENGTPPILAGRGKQ